MALHDIKLHLTGLSCGSCVGRAERALQGVPGVQDVAVNLANETAAVRFDDPAELSDITGALLQAGYPAQEEQIVLHIANMSCASCVGRVERALADAPGVKEVAVNLASEKAKVTYIVGMTTPDGVAAAATDAGYPAQVPDRNATVSDRKDAEALELKRDLTIAAVLTAPVFAIEMGGHFVPGVHALIHQTIGMQASWVLQFVLVTLVLAWPGRGFFAKGLPALFKAAPDMNALVAMGTGAAWVFSTVATFLPGILPQGTRAVYFEAAAVIVTLILLGRYLEARAKGRTGQAIRKLVGLQPQTATVVKDGIATMTPIVQITTGDIIRVHPGERIALDGVVAEGRSYVDESMISGEPVPVEKAPGAAVIGGTVNGAGSLSFEVTKTGDATMLAQIIRMVEDAQGAKLPIQDLVNKITLWFVPAVILVAALTVIMWLVLGPDPALSYALVAGVAVLIVACPCAMGLATPTSIMVGTGRAAEMGVLFRKGDALQALQNVRVVAFDKTGTLTAGRPELTALHVTDDFEADSVLQMVASVEALSEHPIAAAIVRAAENRGLGLQDPRDFTTETGFGVSAMLDGRHIRIGADRFMRDCGIDTKVLTQQADKIATEGQTPIYAAIDGQLACLIGVSDPIKPEAPQAVNALRKMGLRVAMMTGDNAGTANAIAAQLGIDLVVAEVLPDGKVAALDTLQATGDKVVFIGDGINDAPALATADVGIAIGTGTDIAIESADVVLMSGDITGVVNAFDISRRTMRNIRQNLFWAFAYNTALIPVAAGVLYVFGGPLLSPMIAAGAMALSSVFVLSNALRLRWVTPATKGEMA
ncbi:heavy metal translocating P-type ATPase [Yoonia sp. F2084L]|uniref:heavy metal translocating P-type ATPase n=1 Tax=Yoonia sp. F2084L TaxID=2926419 RepID=UPI001FF6CA8C|nr:heavy metal translocating P-type ATPase [Yoonia sp. F2084L]MCK0096206.1 heavy metal translocating P-type ATPase [Yoonia sp. F2084L]